VHDAGVRRDDLEVVERGLAPAQERVALAVALELELGVAEDRARGRVLVDLHGVVDDELRRQERVDPRRISAEVLHRVPHRGEVDNRRDAGEVLEQHARGAEGDLVRLLGARRPTQQRLRVRVLAVSERVLEQDSQCVGEPHRVRVESEHLVAVRADGEGGGGHPPRLYLLV
jgi:hypothetical protein